MTLVGTKVGISRWIVGGCVTMAVGAGMMVYGCSYTTVTILPAPIAIPHASAVDGDTIRAMDGKPLIRLARIDAPELSCPGGEASKAFLAGALAAAGPSGASCQILGPDFYGRRLAECSIDGLNISDVMLELGKAKPYVRPEPGERRPRCG